LGKINDHTGLARLEKPIPQISDHACSQRGIGPWQTPIDLRKVDDGA
jgi:hypothetical protein